MCKISSELSFSANEKSHPFGWLSVGGEGEIRTLEPLLTVTRFPIVRPRPARRLLHFVLRLQYHITIFFFCQYVFSNFLFFILIIPQHRDVGGFLYWLSAEIQLVYNLAVLCMYCKNAALKALCVPVAYSKLKCHCLVNKVVEP